MVFDVNDYKLINCSLVAQDDYGSRVTFRINPETITESIKANLNSVQTINSNLPRHIINGTKGREVSFKALIHGLANETENPAVAASSLSSSTLDLLKDKAIAFGTNVISKGISVVPFAANVLQGINSLQALTKNFGFDPTEFEIQKSFVGENVDGKVQDLFNLMISTSTKASAKRVLITGYPFFDKKTFYITEVSVNRKFFDKKLRTQFAEVTINLTQVGVDKAVGSL